MFEKFLYANKYLYVYLYLNLSMSIVFAQALDVTFYRLTCKIVRYLSSATAYVQFTWTSNMRRTVHFTSKNL